MKKAFITLMLCLGIVTGSASVVYGVYKSAPDDEEVLPNTKLPNVAVEVLQARLVEKKIIMTGTVMPWESVKVSAEISGKIEWQGIDDGQSVQAGQEIIRIDTTSAQARMDQAVAEHDLTKQEFDRIVKLQEGGISSPQDFDRVSTNREAAKANFRLAKIELDKSVITAQIPGIVDVVFNEEGEFVTVGNPLLRIVQVDKIKVQMGMPERDVIYCKPGESIVMRFDAYPDELVTGKIHRVATTADFSTRTFLTEIEVDNASGKLKPGMIARLDFVREAYPGALTVPLFAVLNREDEHFVFVESGDTVHLRKIQPGFFQKGRILVMDGLKEGERVVVTGQRDIRDGQSVRVGEVIN